MQCKNVATEYDKIFYILYLNIYIINIIYCINLNRYTIFRI